MKNLADDPAHGELLRAMRERLEQLYREYDALPLGQNIIGVGKKARKNKQGKVEKEK